MVHIAELTPGINDQTVLQVANTDERALLKADKDFGELVFRLCQKPKPVAHIESEWPPLSAASEAAPSLRAA